MRIWSTKYVLTEGIELASVDDDYLAKVCSTEMIPAKRNVEAAVLRHGEEIPLWLDGENKEWHRSLEGAQRRARIIRDKRVESLRQQIAKLEEMSFGMRGEEGEVSGLPLGGERAGGR